MAGKRVLHMGLISPPNEQMRASGATAESIVRDVEAGAERARGAGYEVRLTFFEPEDFSATLAAVRGELETGRWDALVIGGGVRMAPHLTPLFERAVNMAVDVACRVAPGLKVLFQAAPGDILETVRRGFEEDG